MALDISQVMDKVGASILGLGGLYVYDYPPDSAQPPFAYVDMPEAIDYDAAMGRGCDRTTLQIHVGVAGAMSREARDAICAYASTNGATSLKLAIEHAELGAQVRVTKAEFATIQLASGSYLGLVLTLDVIA